MSVSVTGFTPLRQTASRILVGLLLLGSCGLLTAKPVQRGLDEKESFTATVQGSSGLVRLQLIGAAVTAREGSISVTNDNGYVWWTSPLKSDGGDWLAPLNPSAVEALLVGTKVQATFPKAAGEDDVVITIPVETARAALKDAGSIMAGIMPFFREPSAPDKPALPSADSGERTVADFASEAISWDRRMTAYGYDYAAAISRARSLWLDLVTAGRVPWITGMKKSDNFADVDAKKAMIETAREAFRKQAIAFVQKWNDSHVQSQVQLKFDEAAA